MCSVIAKNKTFIYLTGFNRDPGKQYMSLTSQVVFLLDSSNEVGGVKTCQVYQNKK